jgi:SAM-dependent methyltransferase
MASEGTPPTLEERKRIERGYYDRKAAEAESVDLRLHGPAGVEPHLRAPYLEYQRVAQALAPSPGIVVDLGAGTGLHSLLVEGKGVTVLATDISAAALDVALVRARQLDRPLLAVVADGETLPFRDAVADVVTSAGVLYCMDLDRVIDEVLRILRPGGAWVFVDSYDHSPVYRINRFVGYLRGTRTRRAFTHIPNAASIAAIRARFADVTVHYFGVWTFLWPVLRRVLGGARAAALLGRLEPPRLLRRFAFKIVVVARARRSP